MTALPWSAFFDRDARTVARGLLGKVIRRYYRGKWLAAQIIETEAYYLGEKASHASLGYTDRRRALFMPPGTIYMYYARGGDSLNVSCRGKGNAVLIKSAVPYVDARSPRENICTMLRLNPVKGSRRWRPVTRLCAGQTLLCRALALRVPEWDQRNFDARLFYIEDVGSRPVRIIQARRLGIPAGRDEHLLYRFIDYEQAANATHNPLTSHSWREGEDYRILRR